MCDMIDRIVITSFVLKCHTVCCFMLPSTQTYQPKKKPLAGNPRETAVITNNPNLLAWSMKEASLLVDHPRETSGIINKPRIRTCARPLFRCPVVSLFKHSDLCFVYSITTLCFFYAITAPCFFT